MTGRRLHPVPPPVVLRNLEPLSACVDCARLQAARWILGWPRLPQVCTHGSPAVGEVEVPRGGEVVETRSA